MRPRKQQDGAGTIERRRGKVFARVSLPDGTRPRYELPEGLSDAEQRRMAKQIAERECDRVEAELALHHGPEVTVEQFGKLWTDGKLLARHGEVNGLRDLKSAPVTAHRLAASVYPLIGHLRVSEVTEADIERVMREAPRKAEKKRGKPWRQMTKINLYSSLRRLFSLAVMPGRLRRDNPVSPYLKPSKGKPRLFGFLYPSELLELLGCSKVPVGRRVLYALAVYTGLRKGSLYALRWSGVDFRHRTLTSLQSKTGLPQLFELPEGLAALLQAWHEHRGKPAGDELIIQAKDAGTFRDGKDKRRSAKGREAEALRHDLVAVGIERVQLFAAGGDNVERIRFHDLRATFVTWAMRQGRGDGWISDRTGHLTPEMRTRYARQARTLADLKYDPFPDISTAIPELAELPDNVRRVEFGSDAK